MPRAEDIEELIVQAQALVTSAAEGRTEEAARQLRARALVMLLSTLLREVADLRADLGLGLARLNRDA